MATRLLPPTAAGNNSVLADANCQRGTVDDANVTVARAKRALKPSIVYTPQVAVHARGSSEGSKRASSDSRHGTGSDGQKKKTGGSVQATRLLPPTVRPAQDAVMNEPEGVERNVLADANRQGGSSGKDYLQKVTPAASSLQPPSVRQPHQAFVSNGKPTEAAVRSLVEEIAAMGARGASVVTVKKELRECVTNAGIPVEPSAASVVPVIAPLHGEAVLEVTGATRYYNLLLKPEQRKRSAEITVGGFHWQLETFAYWDERNDADLGVYVYCRSTRPKPWIVTANYVIRVQRAGAEDRVEKWTDVWESKMNGDPSSGWLDFMPIRELLDVTNGFLKDDKIRIRFSIVVLSTDPNDAVALRHAKMLDGDCTNAIEAVDDKTDLDHLKKQVLVAASNEELKCWAKPEVLNAFSDSTKSLLAVEATGRLPL